MTQYTANQSPARYLDGRVMTASQPELQLMLLEGAVRFGRQAQQVWEDASHQAECDRLLGRTSEIVEELVRSVAGNHAPTAARLEEEYAFVFRQLAQAQVNRDPAALETALSLLAFHRETWKLACDQLKTGTTESSVEPARALGPHANFNSAAFGRPFGTPSPGVGSFSFEA